MVYPLQASRDSIEAPGFRPAFRSIAWTLTVLGSCGVLLLSGASGRAQSVDCEQLRQQLASVTRPDPNRDARFARAIQQQRSELARTQAYSDQIGCGGGFPFFGGSTPPQCDTIADRIARMEANLETLDAQARALRNGDPDRESDLAARYDAYCRTSPVPGQDYPTDGYTEPGMTPDGSGIVTDDQAGSDGRPQGGGNAICVRTCDGGYFPIGSSVRTSQLDDLQTLCSAQCPNTEAKLYTTKDMDNVAGAIATDGTPYTALPTAFKFQKTFDASCTCKPPNQNWVQALARAEQLLDRSETSDVTVTEKMSADMARPSVAPVPSSKKGGKQATKVLLDRQAAAEGALGAVGAQAPTAGNASAGIAEGAGTSTPTVKTGEGEIKSVRGPGGITRQVRIIAPAL